MRVQVSFSSNRFPYKEKFSESISNVGEIRVDIRLNLSASALKTDAVKPADYDMVRILKVLGDFLSSGPGINRKINLNIDCQYLSLDLDNFDIYY